MLGVNVYSARLADRWRCETVPTFAACFAACQVVVGCLAAFACITQTLPHLNDKFMTSLTCQFYSPLPMNGRFRYSKSLVIEPAYAAITVNRQEILEGTFRTQRYRKDNATMKTHLLSTVGAAVALLSFMASVPVRHARAQDNTSVVPVAARDFVPPTVFQAAGPSVASIQSSVTEYRAALGGQNNGIEGPKDDGRREINWDGGGLGTTVDGNPMDRFLGARGALFTTPDGTGFVQATPEGLAGLFNNPTYGTIFHTFSQFRLFSAVGGKITDVDFFLPGGGNIPATTKGFGAVFTDVDQPDGSGPGEKLGNRKSSTLIEYFGINGELLSSSFVPASPGDGGQSFLGIVFPDARIARVRITSGDVAPGPDDDRKQDVVMMDDFIYGEPKQLP